jgi:DinB superfamily
MRVADPVEDPKGYREYVLSYPRKDDPAEVQARTPAVLRELVRDAGDDVKTGPADGEWSVLECVGHITGAEIVSTARYRWIVAQDRPTLVPYDQDLWVERLRANEADPNEVLDLFDALRRSNLALWERSSEEERARIGMHEERGPESFELVFRLVAGHDRLHSEQAEKTLRAVRSVRT